MANNQFNHHSFQRSQSADSSQPQSRISFTIHSSNTLPTVTPVSFQRRTVESARQLRESFSNVIREIEPLVETARTVNAGVTNFLNSSQSDSNISSNSSRESHHNSYYVSSSSNDSRNDSYFINLDIPETTRDSTIAPEPDENVANANDNNMNPSVGDNNTNEDPDGRQTVIEFQQFLRVILKYIPFVLILLAKAVYDYHENIFILLILFVTFAHTNSTVRKEAIKRQRRCISNLALELLYIFVCLIFIHFVFSNYLQNFHIVKNLLIIRTFTQPFTVWNLLWIVTITDFILKLLTVTVKILLTMLPATIVEFKKRGKIYLFIEAISQIYRSLSTIHPWLHYLLDSYPGPERIVAVFLSAFYITSKGASFMAKGKLLKKAFFKLLQNVSIGSSPNKDQIQRAGEHCAICLDEFDTPVLLQCHHIFCESCVSTWFDREQACPLCRAKIVDDPSWRDGSTSYFVQLY